MTGFIGKDAWEEARIQEIVMAFDDVGGKMFSAHVEQDPEKKAALTKSVIDDTIKPLYKRLENCLDENGTGYFVGNQV